MKKVVIIGSGPLHQNYQSALENVSCKAVIFPGSSYVEKHPDDFDGLLLPGGGDVLSSLGKYASLADASPSDNLNCQCSDFPTDFPTGSPTEIHLRISKHNAGSASDLLLDLEQLRALHLFHTMKKPVFGICKGMQLINLYFHGTIREVSNKHLHRNPKKDAYHPADNLPGSFLHALFGPHMLINSNHHQCIDGLGKNLQIIQNASDGTIEAISHLSAPVIGTQWHPERMPKLPHQDAMLLFRYFISLL